jgi:CelD/BcsL family acetyltransferase involved in cellulose biosynthesis
MLDLRSSGAADAVLARTNPLRRERWLDRSGTFTVRHFREPDAVAAHLPDLFAQHVERWAGTPTPSMFIDPLYRRFYAALAERCGGAGWLRLTRLDWEGRPIAMHVGFSYGGRYLWYTPTHARDLAQRSPGTVLLRQVMLAAIAEGGDVFDFGRGDEAYKREYASSVDKVADWWLYEEAAG